MKGTEIWLRIVYKTWLIYDAPLNVMGHIVAAIEYYARELENFKPWFVQWYQMQNVQLLEPRELLYPTWQMEHAKGFARWTHDLAYNSVGHVTEQNPKKLYNYRFSSSLIRKIIFHFERHFRQLM